MALVVFTGGARSGKSSAAARLAAGREADGAAICVVVFGRESDEDPEFASRIARHRADRPAAWKTVEAGATRGWMRKVPEGAVLVVDCVGTLLGLAMEEAFDACGPTTADFTGSESVTAEYEAGVAERFDGALDDLLSRSGDTIVVTNEVGDGVVPGYASGRLFRDLLGAANRRLVNAADCAYISIAGRLIELSALPNEASWPRD